MGTLLHSCARATRSSQMTLGEDLFINCACVYVCVGYRYVQFSVRVGSGSASGSCPSPDVDNELVTLQSTCNGGIDWHLLRRIDVSDKYTQPMYAHSCTCMLYSQTCYIACRACATSMASVRLSVTLVDCDHKD